MPAGYVNTDGGLGGGLARGLEAGLRIGSDLYERGQDQQYRQAQLGIQMRAEDRLDRDENRTVQESRANAMDKLLAEAYDSAAGYANKWNQARDAGATPEQLAALNQDPGLQAIQQRIESLKAQRLDAISRAYGPDVLDGVQQAKTDASALKTGQATPAQLGPVRFSNVVATTGHPGIDYVDHDSHPDGRSPVGAAVDNVHSMMNIGDHRGAADAAFPLVSPQVSAHPPGHDLHVPGVNGPYAPEPNEAHPHVGQSFDVVGAKGALQAAVSSDPQATQLLTDAHDQGATQAQNAAMFILQSNGGVRGLADKLSTTDEWTAQYAAIKRAILATTPGYDSMSPAQRAKAEQDAGKAALDRLETSQYELERMRENSPEARSAAARNNAEAGYYRDVKGQRMQPVTGSDGLPYAYDPISGKYTDGNGNPAPSGITFYKPGTAPKPSIGHRKVQHGLDVEEVPYTIVYDQSGQPVSYRDLPQTRGGGAPGLNLDAAGRQDTPPPPAGFTVDR